MSQSAHAQSRRAWLSPLDIAGVLEMLPWMLTKQQGSPQAWTYSRYRPGIYMETAL